MSVPVEIRTRIEENVTMESNDFDRERNVLSACMVSCVHRVEVTEVVKVFECDKHEVVLERYERDLGKERVQLGEFTVQLFMKEDLE